MKKMRALKKCEKCNRTLNDMWVWVSGIDRVPRMWCYHCGWQSPWKNHDDDGRRK